MARKYTKARLAKTLSVLRQAWEGSADQDQRPRRKERRQRQARGTSLLAPLTTYDDAASSSDEYVPEAPGKRRHYPTRLPKAKRVKHDPEPANPKHTTLEENRLLPSASLVTLKIQSFGGKLVLNALAGQHDTGYEKKKAEELKKSESAPDKTFSEKMDEICGKIDKGTTRSGLKRKFATSAKISVIPSLKDNTGASGSELPILRLRGNHGEEMGQQIKESRNGQANPSAAAMTNTSTTSSLSPGFERPIDTIRRVFLEVQALKGNAMVLSGQPGNPVNLITPSPSPEPEPKLKPALSFPFIIKTPWAHPIDFKHPVEATAPCHFCGDFRYGIFGYGLLEVKVRLGDQGGQLIESEDAFGHRFRGKEATRMCVKCSSQRLYIMRCRDHMLQRFGTPEDKRFHAYTGQLLDKNYPRGPALKVAVYYTCSLCTQPAFWRCIADQSHDLIHNELSKESGKGKGCGLMLCGSCAERLEADGGVLKKTTVQKANSKDCRRADMEFLFAGSLLDKAYR